MEAPNFFRTEYSDSGSLRDVEVVFGAYAMLNEEFSRAVWKDFTWAFLSLFAVWVYMMFHLGSVFLSVVGAFEVFMAFPTGLFFYRTLFQVRCLSLRNLKFRSRHSLSYANLHSTIMQQPRDERELLCRIAGT